MLTPSSNTVLEPMTAEMLVGLPDVSAHFARFQVSEIALDDDALGQFELAPQLAAARLLADARVHVVAWNGTSGGWTGFETDRRLCEALSRELGVPATTSTLATADAFRAVGARRYALVTPYLPGVQTRIIANFRAEGFECVAERHLGQRDNFSFSEVSEASLENLCGQAADSEAQAIAIFCTNLQGARLAPKIEDDTGIAVMDSVSVTLWRSLLLAGADPGRVRGWGRLFDVLPADGSRAGPRRDVTPPGS